MVVKPNFISDPLKENNTRGQFALFIGRLSQEKGIEFLLESWKEIDFPLKIVGDGPMMGNVKLQGNNVEFCTFKIDSTKKSSSRVGNTGK